MTQPATPWVVILAGGEGRRLQLLTTVPSGDTVPKQFCSLQGGPSLLGETLRRARILTSDDRICVVVAAQHQSWWQTTLASMPPMNVFVEPAIRGTAMGMLLPLLHIAARERNACVVLLPCDHYVRDEQTQTQSLLDSIAYVGSSPSDILLLGMQPETPDPELGYLVPGERDQCGTCPIVKVVEKPTVADARQLIADGALLNTLILVAAAEALIAVIKRLYPHIVAQMRSALYRHFLAAGATSALIDFYRHCPHLDFSIDVLQKTSSDHLRVVPVPQCGWSDLGTPEQVADVVSRLPPWVATDLADAAPIDLSRQLSISR